MRHDLTLDALVAAENAAMGTRLTVNEWRSMNAPYIDRIASAVATACGESFFTLDQSYKRLYRLYALLALTVGTDVTQEHVHDAWSAWRIEDVPDHRSLKPFSLLTPDVQMLDQPYVDGIAAVAAALKGQR
jgi:predicted membrane-bound mannosyltransferase